MKKLVLTTVCALAVTGAAFAQGFVNWASISFANVTAQTNSTQYSPFLGGGATGGGGVASTPGAANTGFNYELLYTSYSGGGALPTIPSLASLLTWNDAGLGATNSNSAGRLTVENSNAGAAVPWAAGVTDSIVLVGWSANLGTSWGAVSNELKSGTFGAVLAGQQGFFGVTTTGFIAAGASSVAGATVFNSSPVDGTGTPIQSLLTQLYLLPVTVPEPTTIALAGLGGLALMLFRRQRK
jgi:hypothetical protein